MKLTKGNGQQPSQIVRPSSLNYKISLREAVAEFIKKEMPDGGEPKTDTDTIENKPTSSKSKSNNHNEAHEDFCDLMFDMTINQKQVINNKKNQTVATPEAGLQKDAWFREEEIMRKKLEKGAINQLKSRIAQQNRLAGSKV